MTINEYVERQMQLREAFRVLNWACTQFPSYAGAMVKGLEELEAGKISIEDFGHQACTGKGASAGSGGLIRAT